MRRIIVLVAVVVGALAAAAASAEVWGPGRDNPEGQLAFGVTGGLVEPHGQIGNEPNWSAAPRTSGLDLRYGWKGSVYGDFYMTSFLTAGVWGGVSDLRMRDQVVSTPSGTETVHALLLVKTTFVGARLKGFLPTERSWTPYACVGLARYVRRVDIARGVLLLAPGTDVFEVTDDRIGFDVGVGVEQPLARSLAVTLSATYFNIGALKHDLPWTGGELVVNDWQYWSVDLGLKWHMHLLAKP
jgi:opacity protein-like surface antigen